jgi:hypothetical protein
MAHGWRGERDLGVIICGVAAWREILLPGQATRRGAAHVGQPFFRLHSSDYPLVLFLHDWQFGSELASCSLQRIVWHSSLSPLFSLFFCFFLLFLTRLKGRGVCIFYTRRTVRESGWQWGRGRKLVVSSIIEHSDYLYSSIFKYIYTYFKTWILSKLCCPIRHGTIVETLVLPKDVSTDHTYGYGRVKHCFCIIYRVEFKIRDEVWDKMSKLLETTIVMIVCGWFWSWSIV